MNTTVIVTFDAKPEQADNLQEFLSGIQEGMMEHGGKSVRLLRDQDTPTRFYEIEEWPSPEAHKQFVKTMVDNGALAPVEGFLVAPFAMNYLDTVKQTQG